MGLEMANETMIIVGADCKGCIYLEDDKSNKNKVICKFRNKKYYYGACIPCEDKEEGDK